MKAALSSLKQALMGDEPSRLAAAIGYERVQQAFAAARAALVQQALRSTSPLRDYAATLMVVILARDYTIGGLIGDWIRKRSGAYL